MTWGDAVKLAGLYVGGALVAGLVVGLTVKHPLATAVAAFTGGAATVKMFGGS